MITHHYVMISSLCIKNFKFDYFSIFRVKSIIAVRQAYLMMLSTLISVSLGAQRAPLVDKNYPLAALHKQANRACKNKSYT